MRLRAMRHRLLVVAVVLTAAVAFPLGVIANHRFSDVPTSNTFHDDIDAIADVGVTTGCAVGKYCPKDFVTREQMAAFLNRLGALGPGKTPVVNADKVDGIDEVLAAGPIVISQQGPWFPLGNDAVTTRRSYDVDTVSKATSGIGLAIMSIDAPNSIGGTAYGLATIQVCVGGANSSVLSTTVSQSVSPGSHVNRIVDAIERQTTSDNCYTLTDPAPDAKTGGVHLTLEINFSQAAGVLFVNNVTTTWVPVG
jgi:hypothetical protein